THHPALSARAQLPRSVHVAVGWHALHLDDVAHLLPLRILPLLAERPVAALLDQYGSHGDLRAGRLTPHPQCGACALSGVTPALPERLHRVLLGDRNLVDSHAAGARGLALWR